MRLAAASRVRCTPAFHPNLYPHPAVDAAKSRQQVKAELAEARRHGDLVAVGETGQTYRDLYPQRYGTKPATASASGSWQVGHEAATR